MTKAWSEEQLHIIEVYKSSSDNLCISAAPGSGKTTLLEELWRQGSDKASLYLAFNKAIVIEAEKKLPHKQYSAIKTFHSLGASLCFRAWKSKVNDKKVYRWIKEVEHTYPDKKRNEYSYYLYTLINYCKGVLSKEALKSPSQYLHEIQDATEFYSLEGYDGIEKHCASIIDKSNRETSIIDFNDMLVLPILYDLEFPFYEEVLVDEAQDVNAIQREFLFKLRERNRDIRYVFVGDHHQSIYAFRGALYDSIERLKEDFSCTTLSLTISWRCPITIVEEAKKIFPKDINASPHAITGSVRVNINDNEGNRSLRPYERNYPLTINSEEWDKDAFILCRTFAPLVSFANELLRAKIPCHIKGRDIAKSFISYIKKSELEYVPDFLAYAQEDLQEKARKAYAEHKYDLSTRLIDKYETLSILCHDSETVFCSDVIAYIESLFREGNGIALSTIHRSKGLEAKKVFLLASDIIPHALAKKDWELIQERNMLYVAITRAKEELVYIGFISSLVRKPLL